MRCLLSSSGCWGFLQNSKRIKKGFPSGWNGFKSGKWEEFPSCRSLELGRWREGQLRDQSRQGRDGRAGKASKIAFKIQILSPIVLERLESGKGGFWGLFPGKASRAWLSEQGGVRLFWSQGNSFPPDPKSPPWASSSSLKLRCAWKLGDLIILTSCRALLSSIHPGSPESIPRPREFSKECNPTPYFLTWKRRRAQNQSQLRHRINS